jgi:hypothetical protein
MRRAPTLSPLFFLVVAAVLVAAMSTVARAEDPVAKVTALNRKALEAYSAQDYDTARTLLKQALEICNASGLDAHPIKARTHIHFGIVAIVGFKQRDAGIKHFKKAMEIEPEIKLTKSLATPELQDAFEEAALAPTSAGGPDGDAAGGPDGEQKPSVQAEDDGGDEDRPSARRSRPPAKKKPHGEDDDDDDGGGQTGSLFLAITGGTGFGIASGSAELYPDAHKLDAPGFALAQLGHVEPEVGYFVSRDLLLSVALRLQYVNNVNGHTGTGCGPDNFCTPGKTALAVLARANWVLGNGPFHWTVGGQIGGGNIRHAVKFPDTHDCGASATAVQNETCVDTLPGGPFLIGPMAGFFYELGSSLNLIVNLNTQLGVPKFTVNFDVNAGIGLRI